VKMNKLFVFAAAFYCCLLVSMNAFGHGEWQMHYNDVARVLNGFGTPDGNDAKAASDRVSSGVYSSNASGAAKAADEANAGFYEVFRQVSGKMDSMPRELEEMFGIPRGALSSPRKHRMLCHGWAFGGDPPKEVLDELAKYGISPEKFLEYWHRYQKETIELVAKIFRLPPEKAKAFAGIIWDLHLLADLEPDSSEFKWVMKLEDVVDDLCKNLEVLLGDRAKALCEKIRAFVKMCNDQKMPVKYIAAKLMDFLSEQKIGTRIYNLYKEVMKGLWDPDVAVNVNDANATRRTKQKVADIDAKKKAKAAEREKLRAKQKAKGKNLSDADLADDVKKNCKECKMTKGPMPKEFKGAKGSVKKVKGYIMPVKSGAGASGYALFVHSKAFKAGAAEGVLAFVISEGVAVAAFKAGKMSQDEFERVSAQNLISSAAVGTATAVAVVLGASPGGPIVWAIGIGGYVLCDIAFDMMRQSEFTLDDVLGCIPDELLEVECAFDCVGIESAFDTSGIPSSFDLEGDDSAFDLNGDASAFDYGL